jgi:hypothetical protein
VRHDRLKLSHAVKILDTEGGPSSHWVMKFCVLSLLALSLLTLSISTPARAADTAVDLELVLAVDVSGSIDPDEAVLQRQGYLAALTSPEVIAAITGGPHGRVAMTYVEWAGVTWLGSEQNRVVADWHLVDGEDSALAFARKIAAADFIGGRRTSISGVIRYVMPLFEGNGFTGTRQIIDISGDGPNNNGAPVLLARDDAILAGIGINGLAILNDGPGPLGYPVLEDLDIYYEECVIAGPGAFVLVADGLADFARAIRRKLVLEIARMVPVEPPSPVRRVSGYDCRIGERQLQEWLLNNPFDP